MNRSVKKAPGSDYTADLAIIRALQSEAANPTIVIDSSGKSWDTVEYPNSASSISTGITLQSLLAEDLDSSGSGPLSASNCIYRASTISRKMPCFIVEDAIVLPNKRIPNIQDQMVAVYAFDEEQSGIESLTRMALLVKLILNNNNIESDNLGSMFMTLLTESGTKNVVDYGWGKQLLFCITTSQFGDMT